jgi:hypothetical protein
MKILFSPEVRAQLKELSEILYVNQYFGFEEDAYKYVEELILDITTSLPNRLKKVAPEHFSKYGTALLYSIFKKNDNTQWYIFFNQENDIYYIRYIGNNHTCSQYL